VGFKDMDRSVATVAEVGMSFLGSSLPGGFTGYDTDQTIIILSCEKVLKGFPPTLQPFHLLFGGGLELLPGGQFTL
jgi:hypothetical protein